MLRKIFSILGWQFLSKMFGKLIVIFMMFSGFEQYFVYSTPKSRKLWLPSHKCQAMVDTTTNPGRRIAKIKLPFMLFLAFFFSSGYQSEVYSILCPYYVTIMKLYKHIRTDLKMGVFLSGSHFGQDSWFLNKIRVIPTKSRWLDSLKKCFSLIWPVVF